MKAPYRNPENYEEKPDMEELCRPSGPPKEILALFMQDMINREEGKVAPDTTGADYFFLDEFITRDMELDFIAIEQDFLKHCSGRLQEFNNAGWYGENECWENEPEYALKKKMLRLMYNGAKLNDPYCVELIKYLYKLYHKKEYNQLKRFRVISVDEIFSLSEDEWGKSSYGSMGRVLGMCRFMGIGQEDSCSILYLLLEQKRKEWIQDSENQREYLTFEDGVFEECVQQIEAWSAECEDIKDFRKFRKVHHAFWETDEFVGMCFRHMGYREDYASLCMKYNRGLSLQMAKTLAILRTINPKRDYTFEEVQRYTVLYNTVSALTDVADDFDIQLGYLTGEELEECEKEDILFRPENIVVRQSADKQKAVSKAIANVAPVSMGRASEDDYLKEIAALRARINKLEQENSGLQVQYRQMKKTQDEAEKLIRKYQSDREELIALREFAYKSELSFSEIKEETLEDMKKAIADANIVIIGGHINWINKLRKQFPNWLFILSETYKTVDGKMLDGKDKVYFFTDHISHVTYGKFIAAVRERKIPFGYLGSLNIEQMIRHIYEDLQ